MPTNELLTVLERLRDRTKRLRFGPPVAYTYAPLDYAWPMARAYVERWGNGPKDVLLLGMNPGPFGMGQTGVPFGEVAIVRDWLRLAGEVKPPKKVHPKRPIEGLACARSEVSGKRLWGAFAQKFPAADDFFARAFVLNYCPLLFLSESGANVTPDKLAKEERRRMEAVCDEELAAAIAALAPKRLVGVGGYAAKRLELVTGDDVVTMPHPSPASPLANRGWNAAARAALEASGIRGLL